MTITKLHLQNFTVFEDIKIDFCEGVNILIGENGTGKTHLLKAMYFFTLNLEKDFGAAEFEKLFMAKPPDVIRNHNTNKEAKFSCVIDGDEERLTRYVITISGEIYPTTGGKVAMHKNKPNAIFIPAKEMLSHSKGFLAMSEKYKIPFDKTLTDIIVNAELPEIWGKLIRNGLIERDTILFWDEPEANLNPQIIPVLVDILLELQRNGVQLFIATHEYNLAKYFEVKRRPGDEVLYHSFYKTDNGVQSSKTENYRDIQENPIEKANERLYDDILDKAAEDLDYE